MFHSLRWSPPDYPACVRPRARASTPPVLDERAFLVAESSELPESPHRAPILAGVAVAMSNERA